MIQTEENTMTVRELQLTHVIEQQNEIMKRLYNDSKEITERFDHVMEENKHLHDAIQDLKEENRSLFEEYETMKRTVQQAQEVVQMFRVLEGYVRDDVDLMNIGRAVVSYVDLLDRKAVERNV
jgi:uncharacterized protein YoxC